ncbi:glycosyltransferase [Actinoplanes sp. NPDC051851]|uniref:glycosyltransferase n=1 Tax=Actinoplanes sp. NPDC051851 TaxID=3154753 RepID=UPI00341549DD
MRVLHIITALAEGGPVRQLRLLLDRLPHESEVVTLTAPGAAGLSLRADGIPVHEILPAPGRSPLPGSSPLPARSPFPGRPPLPGFSSGRENVFAGVRRLRRLIRQGRFDLVHTHSYRAGIAGRIAARLAGVRRVVATEHHLGRLGPVYLAGERLGLITIAASATISRRLRSSGVPAGRITVIPWAVEPSDFAYDPGLRFATRAHLGLHPDVPVIGAVGRLDPAKRFDLLIRALTGVPGAELLLVGDGPARHALERLADIEGVADRVTFAGPVGHPRAMLCAMDVFASPGPHASGLATLEAIAAGLPAVYASCGPLEERIAARAPVRGTHRITPNDRESLPRSLRAELLCHTERGGARLPARTAGPRYDAGHMAAAVGRVYDRVIRSHPVPGALPDRPRPITSR